MTLFSDNIVIDKVLNARHDQNNDKKGLMLSLSSDDGLTIQLKFTGKAREELERELDKINFF